MHQKGVIQANATQVDGYAGSTFSVYGILSRFSISILILFCMLAHDSSSQSAPSSNPLCAIS